MENPAPDSNQPWRLRVLMEPRGFIKILEFVLAVCMFATTAGYADDLVIDVKCMPTGDTTTNMIAFGYPFELNVVTIDSSCSSIFYVLGGDASGAAKFFVCTGVLAFLYIIGIVVWYVFFEHKHLNWDMVPMIDFIAHCIFTLFFFIGSCAWAAGVNEVKYHTDYENVISDVLSSECSGEATCTLNDSASYASLNVSLLFGFLNTIVWGSNVWFVYKETTLFGNKRGADTGAEKPVDVAPNTI